MSTGIGCAASPTTVYYNGQQYRVEGGRVFNRSSYVNPGMNVRGGQMGTREREISATGRTGREVLRRVGGKINARGGTEPVDNREMRKKFGPPTSPRASVRKRAQGQPRDTLPTSARMAKSAGKTGPGSRGGTSRSTLRRIAKRAGRVK